MSRRKRTVKRSILPDPRYCNVLIGSLINVIMLSGKKSIAQRIVYDAFRQVNESIEKGDPIDFLTEALNNIKPKLEVKSRRVGGATYQVPIEINPERQQSLALRWIVHYARSRKGIAIYKALAQEIIDAYNNTGSIVRKKEESHRMAQANRAFAHLRW